MMDIRELETADEIIYYDNTPTIPSNRVGLLDETRLSVDLENNRVRVLEATTTVLRWIDQSRLVCWRRPTPEETNETIRRLVETRRKYFGPLSKRAEAALRRISGAFGEKVEL